MEEEKKRMAMCSFFPNLFSSSLLLQHWCKCFGGKALSAFCKSKDNAYDAPSLIPCFLFRGSLDQSLKDTLKKFSTEKRFSYWSSYVKSLALHVAETEGSGCTFMTEYQMLISAWRMMLIISTTHVRTFAPLAVYTKRFRVGSWAR